MHQVGFFEEAIKLAPTSAEAHSNLGLVYLRQGRNDDGIRMLEQAAGLSNRPEARFQLAAAYIEAREGDKAIAQITQGLAIRSSRSAAEGCNEVQTFHIVNALVTQNRLAADRRPAYVRDVTKVRTLAPILYPTKTLNAAGNYYGHVSETSTPAEQRKVAEARRKDRGVPYLFLEPTVGAIVGNGDDIVLPRGRDKIDWECELAVVIGRAAKYVTAALARDYIFGYTN